MALYNVKLELFKLKLGKMHFMDFSDLQYLIVVNYTIKYILLCITYMKNMSEYFITVSIYRFSRGKIHFWLYWI
jgi:hypothetical protein